MAKKSFVLSNGDGRVTFSNITSASIDDGVSSISGAISASNLYISNNFRITTFINNATASLLSSSGGTNLLTSSITGTTALSGCVGWDGTKYVVTNILNPSDYGGIPTGSWISGNYQENSRVINIETVSSGVLKPAYGGTGLSGSQYGNSNKFILKGSGSAPTAFSTLSASASGAIIVSGEGRFNVQLPSFKPDVRYYGTPGTYTWTRPIGARFARIILQGAGGGGGGSWVGTAAGYGSGGGAGAFTDVTLNISDVVSASIICGLGGAGGICSASSTNTAGAAGGISSYTDTYNYIYANGGAAGSDSSNGTTNVAAGGAGGAAMPITFGGYSKSGGTGLGTTAGSTIYSACGGGAGAVVAATIVPIIQSTNFGYVSSSDGQNISALTFSSGSARLGIKAGTGGGGSSRDPSTATNGSRSSDGGDGYALIISW